MPVYRPFVTCFVDGIFTTILSATTHEAVNEVGTASVVLAQPVPEHVVEGATVELQATIGTHASRIFQGSARGPINRNLSLQGALMTLHCQGWLHLMDLPHHVDVVFDGPIGARAVIRGLFEDREFGQPGRPTFILSYIQDAAGDHIVLGNPLIDEGRVRVPAGRSESYFKFIRKLCDLFGYCVTENQGAPRVSRIFGEPTGEMHQVYTEGDEGFTYEGSIDLHDVVTWWEVIGASYTDAGGNPQRIRSFPASVPASPDIPDPPGVTRGDVSDAIITTQELADAVRNVREIEFSERRTLATFRVHGQPRRVPGQIIGIESPTAGLTGKYWLYAVDHEWNIREGFNTRMTASFGTGDALPAGEDVCVDEELTGGAAPDEENIGAAFVIHLGDETLSWYAQPAPDGTQVDLTFTPGDDFTSIRITGYAHGTNSQFIDGANTDLTISKFELWQDGDLLGSGNLPVLDENFAQQLDYGNLDNWSPFEVPIPGSLQSGLLATLRVIAGQNPALPAATNDDDFELYNVVVRQCFDGTPDLPTEDPDEPVPPNPCTYESDGGTATFGAEVTLLAGPWIWPAGFRYLVISGTASDLTGDVIGSIVVQSIYFVSHGGPHRIIVPGTQDPDDVLDSGTLLTGAGAFEVWDDLGSGPSSDIVVTGAVKMRTFDGTSSPPPFSMANVCFVFTNDPNP